MRGYLICFIFTLITIFISERLYIKNKKKLSKIFFISSFLIPCIISGVRSTEIGADVKSYFLVLYNCYNKGMSLIDGMNIANVEFGYSFIMYLASKFHNIHFSLFINQFLVSLPIYALAIDLRRKNKEKKYYIMTFIVFIYLTTFYSLSLNLLRQSIAISLVVYAYYSYINKNTKKGLILIILASLFHISALVGLLTFLIDYICKKYKKNRILFLILLFCIMITFVLGFEQILKILPLKYSYYIGSKYDNSSFSIMSIVKKIIWIIPSMLYLDKIKDKKSDDYSQFLSYVSILIIDFILYFMSIQLSSAGRLGYYFLYTAYFFIIPKLAYMFKEKGAIVFMINLLLVFFWYNMTVVNNDVNKTYPYTSDVVLWLN